MAWATQKGFINGVASNGVTTLAPKKSATRAQIASIMMRFILEQQKIDVLELVRAPEHPAQRG